MASDYLAITEYNERQLGLDTKSRRTQISMYSDPTHFVFEILQNADDYGATEVDFKLTQDALTIEHNGIAFEQQNVRAITYFGFSTSDSDRMKTGRFGVGFKAVFAFTATPLVYSGDEHFKIFGLYRICSVPYPENYNTDRTRFVLPFNLESEKPDFVTEFISPSEAYSKLNKRLQSLDINALLFTKNIREIRWTTGTSEGHYLREDVAASTNLSRMTTVTDGKNVCQYLVYNSAVEWQGERHKNVEIAFSIADKSLNPISEPLYVLFATKQYPGYKFLINGPFNTTPNRETILDEDTLNAWIINIAASMFEHVLADLRENGMITRDSLAVFPNDQDKIADCFLPIYESIIEHFNKSPLVPTQSGGFEPAKNLIQGHSELKELLGTGDRINFFLGKEHQWAINCKQHSRSAHFLETLCIETWEWRDFESSLRSHFGRRGNSVSDNWLAEQPDEWMGQLYAALWQNVCDQYWYKLFDKTGLDELRITRVQNGKHLLGSEAYFPTGVSHSESLDIPMVKEQVLQVGNDKQKNRIWSLLKSIGVSDYDEKADIQIILNEWYAPDTPCPSAEQHLAHMRQFIQLFRNTPGCIDIFKGTYIFLDNNDTFAPASDFFLDIPFEQTHLVSLLDHSVSGYTEYRQLYLGYESLVDDGFVEFAKKAGVHSVIPIIECKTYNNPDRATLIQHLVKHNTREHEVTVINEDYNVENIDTICDCKHPDVSKCLWRTLCRAKPDVLTAKYRPNQKYPTSNAPSQLVHYLRNAEWVPSRDGDFHKPCDLSLDDLLEGFVYDDSNGWLKAVQFGKNRTVTPESEKAILRKYHIEELIREREGLSESEIEELDRLQLQTTIDFKAKLATEPDRQVPDPERRAIKEAEGITEAIVGEPTKGERTRQVTRTVWECRNPTVKLKLAEYYKGRCQICGDEGFETKSGETYFVINFHRKLPDAKWLDHWGNALCVCPRCHAKIEYGHTNIVDIDDPVLALRVAKEGGDKPLNVPFWLCGESAQIHFTEQHLIAWREIIKAFRKNKHQNVVTPTDSVAVDDEDDPPGMIPTANVGEDSEDEPKAKYTDSVISVSDKSKPMSSCPVCSCLVRQDRLARHLKKAHNRNAASAPAFPSGRRILQNGKWVIIK